MATADYNTSDPNNSEEEAPYVCANHPNTPTYLRCGRCEKPICPRCRVSTPVGFRCYECANLQSVPTYALDTTVYTKAALFGGVVAVAVGALMGFFPGFEFWAALLLGIAVPEAVAAASNQKRGPGLQAVGVGAVVLGFIVSRIVFQFFPYAITLGHANLPLASGVDLLDNLPFEFPITQYTFLWLALALFFTYKRLQ